MQQALLYAEMLDIPFAFSSNGDAFLLHDRTGTLGKVEEEIPLDKFPSPDFLWKKYCEWKGLDEGKQKIVTQDYFIDQQKSLRYYQRIAINRTVEAIAKGQDRILLVMATGTGKTLTAFQIIWRLWKAGVKKRILFLADRNILVDQTKINDFKHFGTSMTKIENRHVDTAFEIYLSLYQAVTGTEEVKNIYKQFFPNFFDLVIIDECHRGSAAEDSAWREILEYFSAATQIGLTATPKETEYVSNIHYFGKPVYSYSLKQGIQDGFLAPYKVVKVHIDRDVEGYRPEKGTLDRDGDEVEDRIYNQTDFDRVLVLDERTKLVARKVTAFLNESGDRFQKTIVFCVDEEHAARMRQALINENADLSTQNRRYVMRITANDSEGQDQLGNFIAPEAKFPVLVTTSRLLSTGVDAQTCRLIVLDRPVGSMTEFKQILGRGTRVHEDTHKYYFTLMDFRGATHHFADPDFDGEPVQIYEPDDDESIVPPDDATVEIGEDEVVVDAGNDISLKPDEPDSRKLYVNGVLVTIIAERVKYLDADGKLITESLRDYSKRAVTNQFASLDTFLKRWKESDRKQAIIDELEEEGLRLEPLADEVNPDLDAFDLICHVAYGRPPLTRRERAENVRKRDVFAKYGPQARAVLDALLQKYQDEGVVDLGDPRILQIPPIDSMGTPLELIRQFGSKAGFEQAVHELQDALYEVA